MPTFLNVTRMPGSRIVASQPLAAAKGVNFLFALELISFVSRPDNGQIAFQNRARLLVTETFVDAFFERVQTSFLSYFTENTN